LQTGLRPHVAALFRRARELGLSTSLDPNWDPDERWDSALKEALPLTDILMPNAQEALHISGQGTVAEALAWVHAQGVPIVAVKRGVNGALVDDGRGTRVRAVVPATGGDSIGAGDSFDAGFLAGWLRGLPLDQCLDIACQCGRSVANAVGGLNGQPTWATVSSAWVRGWR
jgi:sugar/nucleoside kinase (ribokinase family)